MKTCAVLLLLVGTALSAPQFNQAQQSYTTPIPIVSQYQDGPNIDGSYRYGYQTGNGIGVEESGQVKNFGAGEPAELQSAVGSFSYTGPDGQVYQITYTADENGFVPQGAHIPTPPPIPPEILKGLEFIASQPQQDYDERGFPIGQARQPQRIGK